MAAAPRRRIVCRGAAALLACFDAVGPAALRAAAGASAARLVRPPAAGLAAADFRADMGTKGVRAKVRFFTWYKDTDSSEKQTAKEFARS